MTRRRRRRFTKSVDKPQAAQAAHGYLGCQLDGDAVLRLPDELLTSRDAQAAADLISESFRLRRVQVVYSGVDYPWLHAKVYGPSDGRGRPTPRSR